MNTTRYTDRLLLGLYAGMIVLLGTATFLEYSYGTSFVTRHVYHSTTFCLAWGLLAALSVGVFVRRRLWRQVPVLLLHISFLVILAGALTTFLLGRKGYVHLPEGVTVHHYMEEETHRRLPLPFSLRLDSFRIAHYPGTDAPSDYVSYITADGRPFRISMNRIFHQAHVRLYQSSYDEGEAGSWLTVNEDPWGIGLTYAGYLLMGLSMVGVLLAHGGGFRRLLRHPLLRKRGVFCVGVLWLGCLPMQGESLPALNRRQADSLAFEQVIYQGRVALFNTLARDFVKKLTGRETYKGLTAEQVMGGWMLHPEAWEQEPMIYIKSRVLLERLQLAGPYVRFTDLYTAEGYRLQAWWTPDAPPSALSKAILEVDEKVGLILMLRKGTLIRPLPTDGSIAPLPPSKVQAEWWYNRIPFNKVLFMFTLACGMLSLGYFVWRCLHARSTIGRKERWLRRGFSFALAVTLVGQGMGYALRGYIAGRLPLSNGYETMQFMALCLLCLACLLRRRFPFVLPFGFLLTGFALLVAHLGQLNPQITPLMPVLVSPWLSLHVSVIMMAYALLAFILLNGLLSLCLLWKKSNIVPAIRAEQVEVLTLLSRLMLYPAVFLLAVGIFIGAVWANASWGRYWGWDPKEVWALVTMLVYALPLHPGLLPAFRRPVYFHAFCVGAFVCVLITYFGVNFLLGGMHSYAN